VAGETPAPSAAKGDDAAKPEPPAHPKQSPLYHAHHADRYHRQELIKNYEDVTGAKLLAAIDLIDIDFVLNIEEHLQGQRGDRELHVLLRSPGGDGEQAIRAIRVLQSRCSKLVFVIPDMAKSAATLLALGADEIHLGPASDLGPIDPQMNIGGRWYAAKDVISAVEQAEQAVSQNRSLTPLWANLLAEVTALDVRSARAELDRTEYMIRQALGYRSDPPNEEQTETLVAGLLKALQEETTTHATTLGPGELKSLGLPVVNVDANSWTWQCIWRLWALYWVQIKGPIYESLFVSYRPSGPQPA
jgi:ATP-dependent protease ClpP protease subunit